MANPKVSTDLMFVKRARVTLAAVQVTTHHPSSASVPPYQAICVSAKHFARRVVWVVSTHVILIVVHLP